MAANSLFVIKPYLWNGVWVFDDPAVGLEKEPFVSGVPEMIEKATAHLPEPHKGFVAVFSASPFPGHQVVLTRTREEMGGNWYRWEGSGMEGWLCPALLKYFQSAPERIFVELKAAR